MRAVYLHHEPLTFPGWLDLETGRTLAAEPGRTYDVAPVGGTAAADIPEPWFAEVRPLPLPPPPAAPPATGSEEEDSDPEDPVPDEDEQ